MTKSPTLRGLTTCVYPVGDFEAAKKWYTDLLGVEPYFDRGDAYAEFRIGDYQHELGLLNAKYLGELGKDQGKAQGPAGVIMYWYVDDVDSMLVRLQDLGATLHQPPREFGPGYVGASVIDPFGNILGVMNNVHYMDVLNSMKAA
jgi:predicted enzyme related to lactoylglutathione lyase